MQTERGYGFLLKAPQNYPEAEYQKYKALIEKVCRVAEKSCLQIGVQTQNFAIYVRDSIFITVGIKQGKAEFALFEKNTNRLIQECNIDDFVKYVNEDRLEALAYRIENECQAISKGGILGRKNLDIAWDEKYKSERKDRDLPHREYKQPDCDTYSSSIGNHARMQILEELEMEM